MTISNVIVDPEVGVRPRISWGAIFAGAFVALVSFLVLSSIGVAIGFSINRTQIGPGIAVLTFALLVAVISLFFGGWTTSQAVARETKREAMLHGLILWGVIYVSLVMLSYFGIVTSFNIIMGLGGSLSILQLSPYEIAELSRSLGLSTEQVLRLQELMRTMNDATHPATVAWWTVAGILVSLAAAVFGSLMGFAPARRSPMGLNQQHRVVVT